VKIHPLGNRNISREEVAATNVTLYSDGSYSTKNKVGGYAYLLISDKTQRLSYGQISEPTTCQRAELIAATKGLQAIKKPCNVELISDSKYVVNTVNEWIVHFVANPSRANYDLMKELHAAITFHEAVVGKWVKGHSGDEFNEMVNMWAQREAGTYRKRRAR